jgi:hypothetical protein
MSPLQCAYGRNNKNTTCFTTRELKKIGKKLKIDTKNKSKKIIYKQIKIKLNAQNDQDIINSMNIDRHEILPPLPPGYLLNNKEIDNILKQFENVHTNFKSYGAVPYDFWNKPSGSWNKNCINIYEFNFKEFIKNKNCWGMVTNLDDHDKGGSHWVCLFLCIDKINKKTTLEYFDSIGTNQCRSMVKCDIDNIPTKIKSFIEFIKIECNTNNYSFSYIFNKKQHQKGNNECGMYCIYYILNRVNGYPYKDEYNIPDEKMTYLRDILFISKHYCWKCKKFKKEIKELRNKYGITVKDMLLQ